MAANLAYKKIARVWSLLRRLAGDEDGSFFVYLAVLMPVVIGVAGLGTEGAMVLYNHRTIQNAADSAALSVASRYVSNPLSTSAQLLAQAKSVSATYGFAAGSNGVSVALNNPPLSGNFTSNPLAFEVVISRPQSPLLSSLYLSNSINVTNRRFADQHQ